MKAAANPTKAKYDKGFTVRVFHPYIYEWQNVPEDYQAKDGEVIGLNRDGKKAKQVKNTDSAYSDIYFHPYAIQQIHDDRHAARLVQEEHQKDCEGAHTHPANHPDVPGQIHPDAAYHRPIHKKPDLAIIYDHLKDGVFPGLTSDIDGFQCAEYPDVADFLNTMYGTEATK